jgi:hypothetical protein
MNHTVRKYCESCITCQYCKPSYTKPAGLMKTVQSTGPNDKFAIDFMGPLPESPEGYAHVLVIMDHYSKFVMLFPIVRANATALRALCNIVFCTYGAPRSLVSDNSSQMTSNVFKDLLAITSSRDRTETLSRC